MSWCYTVEGSDAVVVPVAAGNPVPARAPDGTYLLYFTNYRYEGEVQNCSSGSVAPADSEAAAEREALSLQPPPSQKQMKNNACGIHLARATRLDGTEPRSRFVSVLLRNDAFTQTGSGQECESFDSLLACAGPWEITYDIAYGEGGSAHWDNCTLTNPGPFVFKNGACVAPQPA